VPSGCRPYRNAPVAIAVGVKSNSDDGRRS
jgi:hypothetical protein